MLHLLGLYCGMLDVAAKKLALFSFGNYSDQTKTLQKNLLAPLGFLLHRNPFSLFLNRHRLFEHFIRLYIEKDSDTHTPPPTHTHKTRQDTRVTIDLSKIITPHDNRLHICSPILYE